MDVQPHIQQLYASRKPHKDLGPLITQTPGLYCFFVDSPDCLRGTLLTNHPANEPLYVGKSEESLYKRDLDTHFTEGKSGSSTVRRSFGAVLRKSLGLIPIRRGFTGKAQDFRSYQFDHASEQRLSAWMREYLWLGWCEVNTNPGNLVHIEKAVIQRLNPPLNLTHSNHELVRDVKAERKISSDLARRQANPDMEEQVSVGPVARTPSMQVGFTRSQRITAVDIRAGQVRFPSEAKALFPAQRAQVRFVLRGTESTGSYDPRMGPDKERSGVLRPGHEMMIRLIRENETLRVSRGGDGIIRLD